MSKADARRRAKERRSLAFDSDARLGGPALEAATDRLLDAIQAFPDGPVSGYMPIHSELDPRPTMTALHWAGRTVCVPVVQASGKPLVFQRWSPETEMTEGAFGAPVPRASEPVTPRILIVPLLAFDSKGMRLGYGGGFYDRTLALLRIKHPDTRAVGFAFAAQEASEIPTEPTDARLDGLVTEAETLLWPRG